MTLKRITLFVAALLSLQNQPLFAFDGKAGDSLNIVKIKRPARVYLATNMDGAIFSTGLTTNTDLNVSTVRFSAFLNYGFTINYDITGHLSVYSGAGIKNVGLVEKRSDSTIKYRTYNFGIPIGFKIGNIKKKIFGFMGGGEDLALNYKQKSFLTSDAYFNRHKSKFSEWFSDRTPLINPYIFAGAGISDNVIIKVQYYFNSFFNVNFAENTQGSIYKPFAAYKINLLYITAGIDLDYGKRGVKVDDDF